MEDTKSQGSSAAQIYRYRGRSSFLNTLDKKRAEDNGRRLVFTNVSHDEFESLLENPPDRFPGTLTFVPSDCTLTIKMTESSVHALLGSRFEEAVEGWLASMGLDGVMNKEWSDSYDGIDGIEKSPDASYTLQTKYTKNGEVQRWPVMALEAGYSEKEVDLENDAKTWMRMTGGTVKAMITMNWTSKTRTLKTRSWGIPHRLRGQDGFDPALTQLLQEVVVIACKDEGEDHFCISPESKDRAIVIAFDDIFASTTVSVSREHQRDFILDEHFLVSVAEQADDKDFKRHLRKNRKYPVV
ncbi:hypothetical protein KEM56_007108 [Ascosphaera pollenicola]|nr:hypothetical protein KEM56_007108 [Ascosphaera pollenicola]